MKTILALILSAFSLCGQAAHTAKVRSKTGTPKPIPAEKQEEVSRKMLAVQQASVDYHGAQNNLLLLQASVDYQQALAALRLTSDRLQKVVDDYKASLETWRKAYDAAGCEPQFDKTWKCPPPQPPSGPSDK